MYEISLYGVLNVSGRGFIGALVYLFCLLVFYIVPFLMVLYAIARHVT